MTQSLETLQAERENLARQIKELDRQIKFVQNNVPKYDINHPDSPIHALVERATKLGLHLKVRQTAKGTIKLELTGNHEDVNTKQNFVTFLYTTPEPITTNYDIEKLCWKFQEQLPSFKAINDVFYSINKVTWPEIIRLDNLDMTLQYSCTLNTNQHKVQAKFYLMPTLGNKMRVVSITLEKEVHYKRTTRNRETTYPIDAQGYAFRTLLSQKGETKSTVFQTIDLVKTFHGTTDDPITRNCLCHELKLFVRKYNLVTNDPPTVKILS